MRSRSVAWQLAGFREGINVEVLSNYMTAAWDGMRHLPYLADNIGTALSHLYLLESKGFRTLQVNGQEQLF